MYNPSTADELQKARRRSLKPGYRFYSEEDVDKTIKGCHHFNVHYRDDTIKCLDCGLSYLNWQNSIRKNNDSR